jgi:hypothetical protein
VAKTREKIEADRALMRKKPKALVSDDEKQHIAS